MEISGKPSGKGVTAVGAVKAVSTSILLQACLSGRHVLHAIGTVVGVHFMAHTETTPGKICIDTREAWTMQQFTLST